MEIMDKSTTNEKKKDKVFRKRILGFMDKYGLYVVLLLCLCIIGATAFLTLDNRSDQPLAGQEEDGEAADISLEGQQNNTIDISIAEGDNNETEFEQTDGIPVENEKIISTEEDNPVSTDKPDMTETAEETAEEEETVVAASNVSEVNTAIMEMPVTGDIIQPYAMEELVYSQTLKEWTVHTGVDIAGNVGTEVRAAMAGIVESIEEDSLRGIVITLAHSGGLKTVYMGLSTKDMVQVGQNIESGQVISGIGRTAAFEITDDPHVHFEVLLNGEYQDPMIYLNK
jgi:murein DD-endopeptidase MepM/ murein hydrolase activator NlpD